MQMKKGNINSISMKRAANRLNKFFLVKLSKISENFHCMIYKFRKILTIFFNVTNNETVIHR
ncbi:hypothetical protein LEP1GSC062_2517 [Leptospira alexanderi serovar Manhao 3 str. L 60]|uniref:Uncharacterized protein n=1 Tax=Leptospira alexanderi serovar Manhao 3 str. L 60 TaxID=1049759 RepID=V6IFK8_9LEPT|nr:hypothetical protein LEP1GSC062_2517 [Leptospira alexanderi serovar Manhao 3 str. L 60]